MRMLHKREFYVPKGAICFRDKESSAVVYAYDKAGPRGEPRHFLIGFHGRAQKPDFHFYYRSPAERERKAKQYFEGHRAHEGLRANRRAAKREWQNPYKVGDVFRSSWGYDQTNIDYYQCVEVRGKHLVLREIAQERECVGWEQHKCVPVLGKFVGEPMRRLAQQGGVKISRCQWASFEKPRAMIGDKPVYDASHSTSYA